MARANFVKKARKAIPSAGIEIGDSYYWWKFRFGGKQVSKTKPRPSQLTQSDFLGRAYEFSERIEELTTDSNFEEFKDSLLQDIEELRDEQEEKLNNMPDQLQESATGELLQERYDALDEYYNDIDGIEIAIDEEDYEHEEDWDDYYDSEDSMSKEDQKEQYESEVNEGRENWIEDKKQEILDEFSGLCLNC